MDTVVHPLNTAAWLIAQSMICKNDEQIFLKNLKN